MSTSVHTYGKLREDVMTHPKTAGFSALEHCLWIQCRCANQLGVLERSIRRMAVEASGDMMTISDAQVERSIAYLVEKRICVWWPSIETLWWIEMADEQAPKEPQKRADFWRFCRTFLAKRKSVFRGAFAEKYPDSCLVTSEHDSGISVPSDDNSAQTQLFRITDNRSQITDHTKGVGQKSSTLPRAQRVRSEFVDSVLTALGDAIREIGPNADGSMPRGPQLKNKTNRRKVREVSKREGATLEDWQERIANLTANVVARPQWRHTLSLSHLAIPGNWERWSNNTPKSAPSLRAVPDHAPSDFTSEDHGRSWGDQGSTAVDLEEGDL